MDNQLQCHVVQDLLIPYIAGDVSQETRVWVDGHLNGCDPCRNILVHLQRLAGAMREPAPPLPADLGRRLLSKIRRDVRLIIAIVLAVLVLGGASLFWGISLVRHLSNMPDDHPVPPASATVNEALNAFWQPIGLNQRGTWPVEYGRAVALSGPDGRSAAVVEIRKYDSPAEARAAFNRWDSSFHVKLSSVSFALPSRSVTRFRSGGDYWYGWRAGPWYIVIQVDEKTPDAGKLRDQVRDRLIQSIQNDWPGQ
jgi:hypothetical protein